nr:hypothetical protein Iba_chr11eCG9700 [Ipomoea batatas]
MGKRPCRKETANPYAFLFLEEAEGLLALRELQSCCHGLGGSGESRSQLALSTLLTLLSFSAPSCRSSTLKLSLLGTEPIAVMDEHWRSLLSIIFLPIYCDGLPKTHMLDDDQQQRSIEHLVHDVNQQQNSVEPLVSADDQQLQEEPINTYNPNQEESIESCRPPKNHVTLPRKT